MTYGTFFDVTGRLKSALDQLLCRIFDGEDFSHVFFFVMFILKTLEDTVFTFSSAGKEIFKESRSLSL